MAERRITPGFTLSIILIGLTTLITLPLLVNFWPNGEPDYPSNPTVETQQHADRDWDTATILETNTERCGTRAENMEPDGHSCGTAVIETNDGGQLEVPFGKDAWELQAEPGDTIYYLSADSPDVTEPIVSFYAQDQTLALLALVSITLLVVGSLVGFKGLRALGSIAGAGALAVFFMIPGITTGGHHPLTYVLITVIMSLCLIMFTTHGLNGKTAAAYLGTLVALSVSMLFGFGAMWALGFVGAFPEDQILWSYGINVTHLFLAILALVLVGVLNDITVAQSSTVYNHKGGRESAVKTALNVGKDHASSAIYTVVFAVLGAGLMTLLVRSLLGTPFTVMLHTEEFTAVTLQSLAGIIGVSAAMPLTTFIAAGVRQADHLMGHHPAEAGHDQS